MSSENIVTYGNGVLRAVAEDIEEFNDEIRQLISRMYLIMEEANGLGLAGPQIGISKRIFVYDVGDGQHAFINPEILNSSGEDTLIEGCLSIPGLQGEVPRATAVTVRGINEDGQEVEITAEGMLARVFQHEIDHLNGKMFVDRADPDTLETLPVTDEDE